VNFAASLTSTSHTHMHTPYVGPHTCRVHVPKRVHPLPIHPWVEQGDSLIDLAEGYVPALLHTFGVCGAFVVSHPLHKQIQPTTEQQHQIQSVRRESFFCACTAPRSYLPGGRGLEALLPRKSSAHGSLPFPFSPALLRHLPRRGVLGGAACGAGRRQKHQ